MRSFLLPRWFGSHKQLGVNILRTLAFVSLLGGTQSALAQSSEHNFGLGLHVGDPNGLVGKYWFDAANAVQATVGWQRAWVNQNYYYNRSGGQLAIEWTHQFLKFGPQRADIVRFGVHAGAGGALSFVGATNDCYYDGARRRTVCYNDLDYSPIGLYLRAPVGFAAYFPKVRIEAYAEVVPAILLNDFRFRMQGGVGGRYYF